MLGAGLFACPTDAAQPKLFALDWPNDTRLQYGIYNAANERYATAYYRILKEQVNGKELYHFKYLGRNKTMSEAAEVWLEPATMAAIRSTRKVVSGNRTLYVDCAYEATRITVRHKYEGQRATELQVPIAQAFYDFEELMWLVPQIDWQSSKSAYLNYFNSFRFQLETTIVYQDGADTLALSGYRYPAQRYRFDVGTTKYTYWTVEQNGRAVPAKIFMNDPDDRKDITFVDLGLDPKKVKGGAPKGGPLPSTPGVTPAQPPSAMPQPGPPLPAPAPASPVSPPASPATPPPGNPPPGEENPLVPPPAPRPGGHG